MFPMMTERWKTFTLKTIAGMRKDQTNQTYHSSTQKKETIFCQWFVCIYLIIETRKAAYMYLITYMMKDLNTSNIGISIFYRKSSKSIFQVSIPNYVDKQHNLVEQAYSSGFHN